MSKSSRQAYLERARATLAARESWRSVFEPRPVSPDSGHSPPANRSIETGPGTDPPQPFSAESLCDKSDKSPTVDRDDEAGIAWRVEAMRQQLRPGPIIPFLVARRDFVDTPGGCLSCGDPCGSGRRYRCGPCARAAETVVNEAWEGRHRHRTGVPQEGGNDK